MSIKYFFIDCSYTPPEILKPSLTPSKLGEKTEGIITSEIAKVEAVSPPHWAFTSKEKKLEILNIKKRYFII